MTKSIYAAAEQAEMTRLALDYPRLQATNADLLAALEAIAKLGTFTGPVPSSYINNVIEMARVAIATAKDARK